MDSPILEVTFKFSDGEYICRHEGGDTIIGANAHKVMFKLLEYEHCYNSGSVYIFTFSDKVKFIVERSENIINYGG